MVPESIIQGLKKKTRHVEKNTGKVNVGVRELEVKVKDSVERIMFVIVQEKSIQMQGLKACQILDLMQRASSLELQGITHSED